MNRDSDNSQPVPQNNNNTNASGTTNSNSGTPIQNSDQGINSFTTNSINNHETVLPLQSIALVGITPVNMSIIFSGFDPSDPPHYDTNTGSNNGDSNFPSGHPPESNHPMPNIIEGWFRNIAGPLKTKPKKAKTLELVKQLKPVKLQDLQDHEKTCSICLETFAEFTDYGDPSGNFLTEKKNFNDLYKNNSQIDNATSDNESNSSEFTVGTDPLHSAGVPNGKIPRNSTNIELERHYAVKLPQCNHIFGKSCIMEWFSTSISCPLCRRVLNPELTENEGKPDVYSFILSETFFPINSMVFLNPSHVIASSIDQTQANGAEHTIPSHSHNDGSSSNDRTN